MKKYNTNDFKGFDWLDFDYLPDSKGFKFEVYLKDPNDLVSESILIFYSLFRFFLDDILIKTFGQDSEWGDFCLDTWDMENERYDYSPDNKKEPTASYLSMLNDSGIEPEYNGYCKCINWDKFLYIVFYCVAQHTAPYSMMFYEPKNEFVFYFHHSGSFGIYYKDFNSSIEKIIRKVQEEKLEIKNTNDKRVSLIAT